MPYGYPNQNWNAWSNYNNPNTWAQNQVPVHIAEVSGKEGAQAYSLPPGSSILLLDKTDSVVWLKTTDDGGFPTINKFYITPAKEIEEAQQQNQYNALEQRLANIEQQYIQLQNQYIQIEEKINNGKSYSSSYAKNNGSNNNSSSTKQSNRSNDQQLKEQ